MKSKTFKIFRNIALVGNVLFFLWILYNGMDEGFKATPVQAASYTGILILLIINAVIIYNSQN